MVSRAGSFLNLLARCLGVSHVVWFDFFQRYDCLSVAIFEYCQRCIDIIIMYFGVVQ